MKTIKIQVENLKCAGCASTITKGILKLESVENVSIDIEQSIVKISFNGPDENIEEFKKKLLSLGYSEKGNNNTILVAKSFVSCAIGQINNN